MKPSWRRLLGLLLVMFALIATAAGCGGDDDDDAAATEETTADTTGDTGAAGGDTPTIVLGTKNFTEQYILGELYRQALEAKGFTVELKSDIGSTEIIDTS